jgi:tRNA/tmRNA/rRNA uracil-C5-methylase (TrmA/RlmC/RlmD family)
MVHFLSLNKGIFAKMSSPQNHCHQSFTSHSKFSVTGTHPINKAQKPGKLLQHILKILQADENSFILDLTSGSASLTHVCAELHISSIAYESDQEQYKESIKTFQRLKGKKYNASKVKVNEDEDANSADTSGDDSFEQQ